MLPAYSFNLLLLQALLVFVGWWALTPTVPGMARSVAWDGEHANLRRNNRAIRGALVVETVTKIVLE